MAYIGNTPGVSSQRLVTSFTATASQTTFTPTNGYVVGYVDVYFNGVKLIVGDDYTASNGVTVVLTTPAAAGDSIETVAYKPAGLSDGYTKLEADARYAQEGANTDITSMSGITGGVGTPDYVDFDIAATITPAVGRLGWDPDTGSLQMGMAGGNVSTHVGQTMHAYVTNAESVTITKGQPVYLYQAQGDRATVKLAGNTSDATSAKTLGLAAENIGANQTGYVICQGVINNVNTAAFNAGDTLYLGATVGTLTATKPVAPNHLVYIGVVERANAGAGQIYVRPQNGYELDEIHDVLITSKADGQALVYESATDLWKNKAIVNSVAGKTGVVTLTNSDVGLGNVENKSSATIRGELTSANVTTALGYTPYNSTNPNGYITSSALSSYLPLTGGTLSGSLSSPNFRDGTGAYNVNLASGGTEGRGVSAGYSGGSYGGVGFNIRHTATGDQYVAVSGDTVSYLRFDSGGFKFFSGAAGAAGRALSFTGVGKGFLDVSGNWYAAGEMYATASQLLVLHSGNYNSYAPTLTGTGASGTWSISVSGSADSLTTGRTISMTGDVAYTSGSFNGSANVTGTATLANSGVTAGTYTNATVTVDAKGRVTSASSGSAGADPIPAGSVMLFVQTSAPTGWTKSTTHNNKALRVVSGTASSGGSVAFTTAFASQGVSGSVSTSVSGSVSGSVGSTTLSTNEMPSHGHSATDAGTGITIYDSSAVGGGPYGSLARAATQSAAQSLSINATGGSGSHNHSWSGSFSGSASSSFSGNSINLAVQYVDVIIATKN